MPDNTKITFVNPRPTVEIHLSDGRVLQGPRGTSLAEFLAPLEAPNQPLIVGAVVNGKLSELTKHIQMDMFVEPVTMGQADGMRIYRRSLTFLLEAAYEDLFPHARLTIDHSVSSGGYFCQVEGRAPLSPAELSSLEEHMHKLANANLPFKKQQVSLKEAIAVFREQGMDDSVRLLKHRKKDFLVLYQLKSHRDYHHGYMVPSTGYLRWFSLTTAENGFVLQFPRRHKPTQILPLPKVTKLLDTFRLYGNWLERLGISSVGALNDAIQANRTREIILVSEALHEQHIATIAAQIAARQDQVRVILIAGPSSSGKTTFSRRLSVQLLALGLSPFPLEMDHYFVNRDKTPRDENGNLDYESLHALDIKRLGSDLQGLIAGQVVQLPHYNFKTGCQEEGEVMQLQSSQLVILEGIHGLNPDLLPNIPSQQTFRIYASALTQLNLDRQNRISTTDTRLLRRIVRDARDRGYNAAQTIQRWESVRRGEKRNIFPYQENADVMFNSALVYELAAIKPYAEPLLQQVPLLTPEHIEAKRLLSFLEWFLPIESDLIPNNSLLKEFLGGSILKDFKVWKSE